MGGCLALPDPDPDWRYSTDLSKFGALASRGVGASAIMIIIKSWVNSWCTTTRYEPVTWPCIFGCVGAVDSLFHYLQCSPLWSRISALAEVHADPIVRIGLDRPTPYRLKLVAIASKCYHALKFGDCP